MFKVYFYNFGYYSANEGTTLDEAKAIGESFKANIEAPLCFHITSPYSDDTTFVFSPVANPNSWDNYCSVSVTFDL